MKALNHRRAGNPSGKIHLWCPDLFEFKGGIGVFSSYLLRALHDWNGETSCRVIVKHDKSLNGFQSNGNGHIQFSFSGRWPKTLRTPAYAAKLAVSALSERPDLIITTHLNFTPAANLIRKMTGIPYWTVAHGIEAWGIDDAGLSASLRNSAQILAVSNFTRNRLLSEQDLPGEQICVLPDTVDELRFTIGPKPGHLLERYKLEDSQPIILTVSRLVRSESYKGYDSLIRALPAIRKVIPKAHYLLVGTGDDQPRVAQMIADLDLKESVTLAGYVSDEELCDHYNLCDVFAMPSKREGFGIVYLEAMACGKPTLGGNKDGAVDALLNGEVGALVDPDDTHEIASTLIAILNKQYPLDLMYQPECLRKRVLDQYGYQTFRKTVGEKLDAFFSMKGKTEVPSLSQSSCVE